LEASEDRKKRNKQFFIGRILILVRRLNQNREEMLPKSRKFIRFSENIFRLYATYLLDKFIYLK